MPLWESLAREAGATVKLIGDWEVEPLGEAGWQHELAPLLLCCMVINSLGILKARSWVAAGPAFTQTGMMSAYSSWSSAILWRIPGAYRASPGCQPALWKLNPIWTLCILACLCLADLCGCCSLYKHGGMRSNLRSSLWKTHFSSPLARWESGSVSQPLPSFTKGREWSNTAGIDGI